MNNDEKIIEWLLSGDVSVQYQVHRDLLGTGTTQLRRIQKRIAREGWGAAAFLFKQNDSGHWGRGFYTPKWISTHYTLLDLRNLCILPENRQVKKVLDIIFKNQKGQDGGINPARTVKNSDVCVNGMVLNYASYFKVKEEDLLSVIDFILSQKMNDGGYNCEFNQSGAKHASLHSTISVIEGMGEYIRNGYTYRVKEIIGAEKAGQEFILLHQFYISDRTGYVINKAFLQLSYPSRWKYDILRALDYFQSVKVLFDPRMEPAIHQLKKKRKKDGRWTVQAHYPGQVHFHMERAGKPSRWNTLRALRVLKYWKKL